MVLKSAHKLLKRLTRKRAEAKTMTIEFDASDEEDKELFMAHFLPELAAKLYWVKHNAPQVTTVDVNGCVDRANEAAWARLGGILGQSKHVKRLMLNMPESGDMDALCAGLQQNRSIEKVMSVGTDFRIAQRMGSFASFAGQNLALREIKLYGCTFHPGDMDTLSAAWIDGEEGTLELFQMQGCNIGGMDLGQFALALGKMKSLVNLILDGCGIGPEACAALSTLLESQKTKLRKLDLRDNPIKDDSNVILACSLAKNTTVQSLCITKSLSYLKRYGNTNSTAGWTALLRLVCDTSSINGCTASNHTLQDVGMWTGELASTEANRSANDALGTDNASLLRDALDINRREDKTLVTRAKVLWGHSRGDFNVADSSIPGGSMPCILEWIGAEDSVIYTQYQWSRFAKSNFGAVKLDAVYRILRSRPGLCN